MEQEKIENRIAILIYLPGEVSEVIRKVKEETGTSYPNHETKDPHVTIYSCKFDKSKFPRLIQEIQNLRLKPFSLKLGKVEVTKLNKGSKNLFASVGFEDDSALHNLHQQIIPVANQLRGDLIREKDIERFKQGIYSQELFSFIEKYGYEHVMENFHPHITLGEVESEDGEKINNLEKVIQPLEGRELGIERIHILLSTRLVPSEKKVGESEVVEISLAV